MKTIAVIEDELMLRENIIENLEAGGYNVVSAVNGLEGIELVRRRKPDLVICDIIMPKLGGYGVLQYIRKDPSTELIPFIFLSALSDKNDRRKGMISGADDYLTKPFTKAELFTAVEARLQKQNSFEQKIKYALDDFRVSLNLSLPHELLTPLHNILGISNLLSGHLDDFERDEVIGMLDKIHVSGQRLQHLVQNYLRFAELESLKQDDERRALLQKEVLQHPDVLVKEIVSLIAERTDREADTEFHLAGGAVRIGLQNFSKIIEELADNAFKFSLRGSKVSVSSRVDESNYVLVIQDHGRGITESQIASLGAYTQFDREQYEQRGVGLGFAIVNTVVDLYQGSVSVTSEVGNFTRITVSLPRKP